VVTNFRNSRHVHRQIVFLDTCESASRKIAANIERSANQSRDFAIGIFKDRLQGVLVMSRRTNYFRSALLDATLRREADVISSRARKIFTFGNIFTSAGVLLSGGAYRKSQFASQGDNFCPEIFRGLPYLINLYLFWPKNVTLRFL
jgi:hypothetical protein